ncbi:glycosyltransferase family 2 protein [Salinarimonas rosea]|uniref:glycosyltransferase family 2 protein n=1 Tax=Salinarimonas rosea TaxID=552063 RepID=UPI0003F66612|nr:glycosyltransferase [Salinarimonas rosea]
MRISIVVPVLDGEAFLAQTLRSVAGQTLRPAEVIVVDNGSTDRSVPIAESFAPLARVIRVPAEGASAARVAGAAEAVGEAIMFLDADDLLGPTVLEELAAVLREEPGAIAACAWMRYELTGGAWHAAPQSCAPRRRSDDDLSAWLRGWYHPPCALLWSREAYEKSGGWDPQVKVNTDGDVAMRAFVAGVPLIRTAGGVSYYRRLPGEAVSLSGRRATRKGLTSRLFVVDRIAQLLADGGRLAPYRHALADAYDGLARDAGTAQPDLAERALTSAREHGGGDGTRALRRRLRERVPVIPDARLPVRPSVAARTPAPDRALAEPDEPLVSVVVPTFERGALLARALRGVVAQTYANLEAIVVDDASQREDIAAVVARFGDPRLRYVRQPENGGVAAARNRGMDEARGSLIAFLDSDDEWLPEKLARQVALMHHRPDGVGLCYTGVLEHGADGDRIEKPATLRGDLWPEFLRRNPITSASGVMIRRSVVDAVGGFDTTLPAIEDYEYWARIARFYEVDCVPDLLTVYHDEGGEAGDGTLPAESGRRSRRFDANMAARAAFAARFAHDAKRAGVRHLFLLESARREIRSEFGSARRAAGALARAIKNRPMEPRLWAWLAYCALPRRQRRVLGPRLAALRGRMPERIWAGGGRL